MKRLPTTREDAGFILNEHMDRIMVTFYLKNSTFVGLSNSDLKALALLDYFVSRDSTFMLKFVAAPSK
jgi:hypothetical protein